MKIIMYNIKMTFLKIKDPKKSDLIVEEFLKTKKNIKDNMCKRCKR